MSGLSDYLTALNRERNWSARRIEQEAAKHGHQISYASASRYLNGTHPPNPSTEMLAALAAAFGAPLNEIRAAARRPGVGQPFDLGPEASRLTGPQREAIRHVVRVMLEQNDAVEDPPQRDGATPRLSVLAGNLSREQREELYRRADQVDLESEPHAAADPEDTSDDDEPL